MNLEFSFTWNLTNVYFMLFLVNEPSQVPIFNFALMCLENLGFNFNRPYKC